ncbi:ATP synthase subunit I [Salidesulfovibrio onnuriiensis]|uniref:ATP synthase subunit I n=1 Tax=Salidesulfovibrio onnuriiensis TaxID=2583823 RepID=UPI0011C79CDF|nr:ATP synthase subunit I [Salidesulfovibrio onnuriiensis]
MTFDPAALALGLITGLLSGVLYFGGLWLTVRRLSAVSRPGLLMVLSFVLRAGLTVAAFALVSGRSAPVFAACLLGFLAVRQVGVRRARAGLGGGEES